MKTLIVMIILTTGGSGSDVGSLCSEVNLTGHRNTLRDADIGLTIDILREVQHCGGVAVPIFIEHTERTLGTVTNPNDSLMFQSLKALTSIPDRRSIPTLQRVALSSKLALHLRQQATQAIGGFAYKSLEMSPDFKRRDSLRSIREELPEDELRRLRERAASLPPEVGVPSRLPLYRSFGTLLD
jgi:hypothetical protein